jgi:aspartyl-tRNA(Asn)/glutamyl-tRNA(Gln) amidotransferase subunit B
MKGNRVSHEKSVLEKFPAYEVVIGIEVHVQLTTKSKIFCSCSNEVAKKPNSTICEICAGYPGVLPVLNKQVVNYAIMAGLATNCKISTISDFDRKHYFYPDLPKGYQITQNDTPICTEGSIPIRLANGTTKNIRIFRIHIEEDAGKSMHTGLNESFVDLNRAGTPLLETVSYPDISSAYEARAYLKALRSIVQYLDICTGNMEEGAFRADTNISVRKKGASQLGTKVELKNINSFKFISDAIEYEIERQITALEEGKTILQQTRLWDTKEHKTVVMRTKEGVADYRYFHEPDLPLIEMSEDLLNRIRERIPELPAQKFERFCKEYGLSEYEAEILIDDLALANYFERSAAHTKSKSLINWILRDLMGYLKEEKMSLAACNVTPEKIAQIVDLVDEGIINNQSAKLVFAEVAKTGAVPADIVKEKGLEQIGTAEELEEIIKEIVFQNPEAVAHYKAGAEKLFGFFVGLAMKKTHGKGNPKVIHELLKKYLG